MFDPDETQKVDFWQDQREYGYYLPPVIVGLHGCEATVEDAKINEHPGVKANPESLFEAQLSSRLGALPEWLVRRNESFEAVSRFSRMHIESPGNDQTFKPGDVVSVSIRYDDRLDPDSVVKTELFESTTFSFDPTTARLVGTGRDEISYVAEGGGSRFLYAVMTNTLGEEMTSDPVAIHISDSPLQPIHPAAGYYCRTLEPDGARAVFGKALKEPDYLQSVKEQEAERVRNAYEEPENKGVIHLLLDGEFDADTPLGTRRDQYDHDAFVFDLGKKRSISEVRFRLSGDPGEAALKFEVQTSNDPDAWLSAYNNDNRWKVCRRVGRTLIPEIRTLDSNEMGFFVEERPARYIRICIIVADVRASEVLFFGE